MPGSLNCSRRAASRKKTDFEEKKTLEKLLKEVEKSKLKLEGKIVFDEEHSLYEIQFGAAAQPEDQLGRGLHRRITSVCARSRSRSRNSIIRRSSSRATAPRSPEEKVTDVLNYIMEDAKKDFTITRFKGLGEMNAEQLWETTMNADTRTLLQVKLEDAVAAEDIFTTLMGENVEARRKFIEENALEVVNLDI